MALCHYEKIINIIRGHGVGINIHACKPKLEMVIYVKRSANGNDLMP